MLCMFVVLFFDDDLVDFLGVVFEVMIFIEMAFVSASLSVVVVYCYAGELCLVVVVVVYLMCFE